jgi:hypothetical protein
MMATLFGFLAIGAAGVFFLHPSTGRLLLRFEVREGAVVVVALHVVTVLRIPAADIVRVEALTFAQHLRLGVRVLSFHMPYGGSVAIHRRRGWPVVVTPADARAVVAAVTAEMARAADA